MKLNLGCGQNKLDGYINVDKYDSFSPETVWDLEKTPWPFDSSSADEITMRHSLEHMGADVDTFFAIIKELYRVGKNGCALTIAVPHPRSDNFTGDPTHVRAINPSVMSLFSKKRNQEWKEKGYAEFTSAQPMKCPGLTQVFTKPSELTGVIYEFIERGEHGFCKDNVKALMDSTAGL